MHPAFWPMQVFVFWADVLMLPWKMMMAPVADSVVPLTNRLDRPWLLSSKRSKTFRLPNRMPLKRLASFSSRYPPNKASENCFRNSLVRCLRVLKTS